MVESFLCGRALLRGREVTGGLLRFARVTHLDKAQMGVLLQYRQVAQAAKGRMGES